MKKLTFIACTLLAMVGYFFLQEAPSDKQDPFIGLVSNNQQQEEALRLSQRHFASQKLKELTIANAQCKKSQKDFGSQVQSVHDILIRALEHELRNGKTMQELLRYSGQYNGFYSSYKDLLREAVFNIEKDKYQYTSAIDILYEWDGLSVIEGFSTIKSPLIVEALKLFEEHAEGVKLPFQLASEVDNSVLYALVENERHFNTYLESPLSVGGSTVVSPSILFSLAAGNLNIDEFKQVIASKSFTVNDVAVAVTNNMPYEHIEAMLSQTVSIGTMPLALQSHDDFYGNFYGNLADVAASVHNVKLLKLLASYNVEPSNEPGVISGLDIAIANLPNQPEDYADLASFDSKYVDTINYLVQKGFKAHGAHIQFEELDYFFFSATYGARLSSHDVLSPELKQALRGVSLVEEHEYIQGDREKDDSLISKAIEAMEISKKVVQDQSKQCAEIRQELLTAEGFSDSREIYDLFDRLEKEQENIAARLHDIDPVLVDIWWDKRFDSSMDQSSDFIAMLRDQAFQQAFDYSTSKTLSEYETNALLYVLVHSNVDALSIWRARVEQIAPTNLMVFKRLSINHWQWLRSERFDFTIKDKFEKGLFVPAALNSSDAIKLLLELGMSPNFDMLGLDVLDVLLDESYNKGKLHDSLADIIPFVKKIERSHFARVARLKQFFPKEYEKLLKLNHHFSVAEGTLINKFKSQL
ncbi:hypothetical protein [Pseudoalteromonas luteoviolacea]|uniref:hypothetical protein n=1 Tax=Pseudoalteromonas luteoviolacea TaxID=43657 RepID=UPI001B38FAC4|nr:hypothetical protein [Pseudoalteromonas luteoviolacea]MBQ4835355.1 hypothetical protein [Pseudoalteromonas luteoviolacea]